MSMFFSSSSKCCNNNTSISSNCNFDKNCSNHLESLSKSQRDIKKAREAFSQKDVQASKEAHNIKCYFKSLKNSDVYQQLEEGDPEYLKANACLKDNHVEVHKFTNGEYLKAFIFGGLDGIVTIFAIVAGCVGADLSVLNIITIGIGNLFADAVSMAFGEYVSAKAEQDFVSAEKKREEWEVSNCPEEEKSEMKEIYMDRYGFTKEDAEQMVEISFKYKDFFIQHMMVEELGLMTNDECPTPIRRGLVMFVSFSVFGLVPLICFIGLVIFMGLSPLTNSSSIPTKPSEAFFLSNSSSSLPVFSDSSHSYNTTSPILQAPLLNTAELSSPSNYTKLEQEANSKRHFAFLIACVFSIVTLFTLGVFKGRFIGQNSIISGVLMALNGSFAGMVAYAVGSMLQKIAN